MGVRILAIIMCILACVQLNANAMESYGNAPKANQHVQEDFTLYMKHVSEKIRKNWLPPDFLEEAHARVLLQLDKDGKVLSAKIVEDSGDVIYDESAFEAIRKSEPFGKFPKTSTRESITINYSFDTSLVKTDRMKYFYELSKKNFAYNKKEALRYINLAIAEVEGDEESYFLYKRRGKIKESMGDYVSAREDYKRYEKMKAKVDLKRVHALKHRVEVEDTAFAYFYLAYAYEQIKDYDNAIQSINKAIERTELNNQYKRYRMQLVRDYRQIANAI